MGNFDDSLYLIYSHKVCALGIAKSFYIMYIIKMPTEKIPFSFSKLSNKFGNDVAGHDRYITEAPKPTERDREAFQAAKAEAAQIPSTMRRLHFKFDRSLTGEQLALALKESLRQQDINPQDVMIRFFSKDRLSHALQTGSDRDYSSNVGYHGASDGEEEWMRGLSIWGNDNVTFVSPIGNRLTGGADAPASHGYVYVLFDKRFLFKVGHQSNGFHAFLGAPSKANIGFISDQGNIQLARPNSLDTKPHGTEGPI